MMKKISRWNFLWASGGLAIVIVMARLMTFRYDSHAVGRQTTAAERPWLTHLVKHFAADEHRYVYLLQRIALSRVFYALTVE